MQIKELTILLKLKKDLSFKDSSEQISKVINACFLGSEKFKRFHELNEFKYYCFSNFYPTEKGGIYKANEIYSFKFRTLNLELADYIADSLTSETNNVFVVLSVDQELKNNDIPIYSLYSITPVVITSKNDENKKLNIVYGEDSKDELKEKILTNTLNKYKKLMGINLERFDFIEDITILNKNKIGISFNYKGGKILGNKVIIKIKQDRFSQELAFMILGAGLLEKNSISFGFCTPGRRDENVRNN